MSLKERLNGPLTRLASGFRSPTGHDFWLYIFFVIVAFVLWMLLSLDNEVQRDFDVPLELQNVPDSVIVISDLPPTASVSVKGKGGQLVRLLWRHRLPAMKLEFKDYLVGKHTFTVTRSKLDARLRDYFGNGVTILAVRPDSLGLSYTYTKSGHEVIVKNEVVATANRQCIISGPIRISPDTVMLYGTGRSIRSIRKIETESLTLTDLKDSVKMEVALKVPEGMRAIPDKVKVTIPVEPLIAKKKNIGIDIVNVPRDYAVILFPSEVEVSYLVPMSLYAHDFKMRAMVDYRDIRPGLSKLPVELSFIPEAIQSPKLSLDSIEFIRQHIPGANR